MEYGERGIWSLPGEGLSLLPGCGPEAVGPLRDWAAVTWSDSLPPRVQGGCGQGQDLGERCKGLQTTGRGGALPAQRPSHCEG